MLRLLATLPSKVAKYRQTSGAWVKQKDYDQHHQEEQAQPLLKEVAPGEIIIGVLAGINEQGQALVNFQENTSSGPVIAISTVALSRQQAGRQVALLFADGNLGKPVIMGLIHNPLDAMLESFEVLVEEEITEENHESSERETVEPETEQKTQSAQVDDVYLDGQRVVLEGKQEIVFKCGEASITLTKAGKILIRGKYLLNRSTGVNRIMGGSVQVN